MSRHMVEAARQVDAIAGTVPPAVVVETCLAMVLLWSDAPQRFRSDLAFSHQLARRVRGLTDVHAGTYWNAKTQRTGRVYRDVPPRTTLVLAVWLREAFDKAGVQLAMLEREGRTAAAEEDRRIQEAIAAMC